MNRKERLLDQIKMYSILVGQQEDMIRIIEQLKKNGSQANFEKQQADITRMIAENTAKIKSFQNELEAMDK